MRKRRINERRRVDRNSFIEIMKHAIAGQFINVCYAEAKTIRKSYNTDREGVDIESFLDVMDQTGSEGMWGDTHDRISDYFNDPSSRKPNAKSKKSTQHTFGFADFSILKVKTITFQWQSREGYRNRYNQQKDAEDELLAKYPDIEADRMKAIRGGGKNVGRINTIEPSTKNVDVDTYGVTFKKNPKTDEIIKNSRGLDALYLNLILKKGDFEGIGHKDEWFVVRDGMIVEKIPERAVKAMMTKTNGGMSDKYFGPGTSKSAASAIKELNDNERAFEEEIKALDKDFIHQVYKDDNIVYVRLSSNEEFEGGKNEPIVWVNEYFAYDTMGLSEDALEFLIKRGTRDVKESRVRFMRKPKMSETMNMRAIKRAVNEAVERYIYGY